MPKPRRQSPKLFTSGKGEGKLWTSRFWKDVRLPDGGIVRRKQTVKLGLCGAMGRNAALTKLAKIVEQTEADERNELNRVCLKASDGSGDLNELSRAIKGRLGELLVAMDLMKR